MRIGNKSATNLVFTNSVTTSGSDLMLFTAEATKGGAWTVRPNIFLSSNQKVSTNRRKSQETSHIEDTGSSCFRKSVIVDNETLPGNSRTLNNPNRVIQNLISPLLRPRTNFRDDAGMIRGIPDLVRDTATLKSRVSEIR